MKVKYLWVLLPIIAVWVSNYILWNFVPTPSTEWWHGPALITCGFLPILGLILALKEMRNG